MEKSPLTPLQIYFHQTPLIPAIRKPEHIERAFASSSKIIFFLTGNPENCEALIHSALDAGKVPIVNLDLLNGFARDKYAVAYLKKCGAKGIISTHADTLRHVSSLGLYAIQRTFLVDSGALETIVSQLRSKPVDALEVLPALVAPKLLDRVRSVAPETVVMGGGLVGNLKEAEDLLGLGLSAVSISNPEMWVL
jgi:glycerol uptake operon antiterminator